jgi:hypothetical protein
VFYTSVTFALIYFARTTIKVGMVPFLESYVTSKQLSSQELHGDTAPGCDASLDVITSSQLQGEL